MATCKPVSKIEHGKVFDGQGFEDKTVLIEDGRISKRAGEGDAIDASGCIVIPGLVDIHFHGACGGDISDGDEAGLHALAAYEASRGITAICPATMTLSFEQLSTAMETVCAYEPACDEADLVGVNLEGPYISPSKVGAQNPEHVRTPDAEEFKQLQAMADGLIKLVDIAPEEPGSDAFIEELKDDVRISVAHTCADYDAAKHAFEKGAKHLTHLYNAMDPMHHRKPGPIPAAAERDDITAEIITDGIHIHPSMVRLAFNMFGDDRMILVSDTLRAAGLEDGTYDLGGQDVTVRGPEARIANGALAGSVSDLMRCLTVAVKDMDIPLASAVKATTINPARAIKIDGEYGRIEEGYVADAVILDAETLEIRNVILRGNAI